MENFNKKLQEYKDFEDFVIDRSFEYLNSLPQWAFLSKSFSADIIGFYKDGNNIILNCQQHGGYMREREIDEFTETIEESVFYLNEEDFKSLVKNNLSEVDKAIKQRDQKEANRRHKEKVQKIFDLERQLEKLKNN